MTPSTLASITFHSELCNFYRALRGGFLLFWRQVMLLLPFFTASCHQREEPSTYVYRRKPDGELIRTEMRNGSANGRIIAYSPSGTVDAIMHVKDSVLTGPAYSFYADGSLRRLVTYVAGYKTGTEYHFYKDGMLESIEPYVQEHKMGRAKYFYPTGTLKSIETYHQSEKSGPARYYYPSGGLQYQITYRNGHPTGDVLEYYERPANHLRVRTQYVLVRGKPWGNGHISYSPSGEVTEQFQQLELAFDRRHYTMHDSVTLTISIIGPRFPRIRATVADFDSLFNGNDSTAGHIFYGRQHQVKVRVRPQHKGMNYLRGYVSDYDSSASPMKGAIYQIKQKNIYFQREYLVE